MPSESGDMKLLGNFSKLIELVSIDEDYNPANAAIKMRTLKSREAGAIYAGTVRCLAKRAPSSTVRSVVARSGAKAHYRAASLTSGLLPRLLTVRRYAS
jgi:hypothetical protein